jgi:hypothetical protein
VKRRLLAGVAVVLIAGCGSTQDLTPENLDGTESYELREMR